MAQAYPASTFVGSDYHDKSIAQASGQAADAGLDGRVRFEVASAQTFTGGPFDLVATFDCLHDMGDPLGAARHIRELLAPDGMLMVVEPYAGDDVTDNLNPVGRVYYSFSTFLCVPTRCPRTAATRWAPRQARPRSDGSPPTPVSPGSAASPRPHSTSCTRSVHSRRPIAFSSAVVSQVTLPGGLPGISTVARRAPAGRADRPGSVIRPSARSAAMATLGRSSSASTAR
jgi:hypothetical protein